MWVCRHDRWDLAMDDTARAPAYWRTCLAALVPSVSATTPGAAPAEGAASAMCAFPLAFCAGPGYGGGCKSRYPHSHEPVRELDDESSRNVHCTACVMASHC